MFSWGLDRVRAFWMNRAAEQLQRFRNRPVPINPDAIPLEEIGFDIPAEDLQEVMDSWGEHAEELAEDNARESILNDLSPYLEYEEEDNFVGFQQSIITSGGGPSTNNFQYYQREDHFSIKYYDKYKGKGRHFLFSLLPAVETSFRFPGKSVPGVMPGIMIHTKMQHRGITIPGGTPVYQSIGLESVEIRLCGLFSGDEDVLGDSAGPARFTDRPEGNVVSGYDLAQFFRQEVVIPGVPVDLDIYASNGQITEGGESVLAQVGGTVHITGQLLIKDFRSFSARASRDYYMIDGFLINYELEKRADPEGTGAAADIEACEAEAEAYRKEKADGKKPETLSLQCLRILSNAGLDTKDLTESETAAAANASAANTIQSVVDLVDPALVDALSDIETPTDDNFVNGGDGNAGDAGDAGDGDGDTEEYPDPEPEVPTRGGAGAYPVGLDEPSI